MAMNTVQKLHKTAKSLSNHAARGNMINNQRSYELIDKYTDLKSKAIEEGTWVEYCEDKGWDTGHDAYDFFA